MSKIEIDKLSYEELHELAVQVQKRLRFLFDERQKEAKSRLQVGQSVSFTTREGEVVDGTVEKINRKTVIVRQNPVRTWKVTPSILTEGL